MLPCYFQELKFEESVHRYRTRNCDIRKIRVKHDFAISSTINNCPAVIKDKLYTHSLRGLVLYCKCYFINNYEIECHIPGCYVCLNI